MRPKLKKAATDKAKMLRAKRERDSLSARTSARPGNRQQHGVMAHTVVHTPRGGGRRRTAGDASDDAIATGRGGRKASNGKLSGFGPTTKRVGPFGS